MIYQNTYPNYPQSVEPVKVKMTASQLAKQMILDSIEGLIDSWQERISDRERTTICYRCTNQKTILNSKILQVMKNIKDFEYKGYLVIYASHPKLSGDWEIWFVSEKEERFISRAISEGDAKRTIDKL